MTKEKTLQYQDTLPSLPLPSLEQTLERYVGTCEPLLTPYELEHTKRVCHEFLTGVGPKLHQILQKRASTERNWLEKWWEHFGYLQPRYPSAVNINYYCVVPGSWTSRDLSQWEAAAIFASGVLKYRKLLLNEEIPVEKLQGKPLCMHTYTRMFNTCIIPGLEYDEMRSYPHDSKHIIVLRNNGMWAVQVLDDKGEELPLGDILSQLEVVREQAKGPFEAVSVLTSENRTNWAKARNHIRALNSTNQESFELIERALFCISLDESAATSNDEIAHTILLGDGHNKWYDKPFTIVIDANLRVGVNGQHMWADALVPLRLFDFCGKYVEAHYKKAFADRSKLNPTRSLTPKKIQWVLDNKAHSAIIAASTAIGKLIASMNLKTLYFNHYGDAFLKRNKLTPDFFLQMAIQLAHYKMHNHVPAVYETAHTRLFYHGRTETIRSLSNESLMFVKTMESDASNTDKWKALKTAIASHKQMLLRCLNGQGVDRHLMGLGIVAEMEGVTPTPAIFTDKAFALSKRYRISTSNVSGGPGTDPQWGGFAPMYEDGYGVCYAIHPTHMNVSISSWNACKETDAVAFRDHLSTALTEMIELCIANNGSKI